MVVRTVIAGNGSFTSSGVTVRFPEIIYLYLKWHEIEGHTPATVRAYRSNLAHFVRFLESSGRSLAISDLSPGDVLEHLHGVKAAGGAPRYVRTRHQHVATFLKWAVDWEFIAESPAARITTPRVPKVRKPFLSPQALQALLDLCPLRTPIGARR